MSGKKEKYIVKIPNDTSILYCEKKRILTFLGPLERKSLKLKLKILINQEKKILKVSSLTFSPISNSERKQLRMLRGTTVALIKQLLTETSTLISQKLKLHGMGYRVSSEKIFNNDVLTFKLGHSHLVFFTMSNGLSASCLSKTKLCIFGNSYQDVTQIAAFIRSARKPEPYKGKGVLYDGETIVLKEGKKV
uniref:ribosomal protein L6 n=1 Tax=Haslea pseudostrearia TaxID=197756 RepID=UPI0022019C5D|nr:ribosomal protein L6 [Haslea pseudostrearia]UXN44186.1 ribosomal protein L6 [Haslea pseudostrearia]